MASIRKRGNSYHVQIRSKSHPPLSASFKDRATALAWIRKAEREIEREVYLDISKAQSTTIREVCDRYEKDTSQEER